MGHESYFMFLSLGIRTCRQIGPSDDHAHLARQFDLPEHEGPHLFARIGALLAGQSGTLAEPEAIKTLPEATLPPHIARARSWASSHRAGAHAAPAVAFDRSGS